MAEKWKCNVCGYVYEGEVPPAICPLCGADRTRFIPLKREKVNLLRDVFVSLRVHSVACHFPNALIPTLHLALLIFLLTGRPAFELTAAFLLGVALAVVPVSMISGLYDWNRHYSRIRAAIFYKKIILASSLLVVAGSALAIRIGHPDLWSGGAGWRGIYLALLWLALIQVFLLGHYGGKLVFEWRRQRP